MYEHGTYPDGSIWELYSTASAYELTYQSELGAEDYKIEMEGTYEECQKKIILNVQAKIIRKLTID